MHFYSHVYGFYTHTVRKPLGNKFWRKLSLGVCLNFQIKHEKLNKKYLFNKFNLHQLRVLNLELITCTLSFNNLLYCCRFIFGKQNGVFLMSGSC